MLRCLRYELCKIFSRKLICILWLLLLVLNGVLFTVQEYRLNQRYFEDKSFFAEEAERYDAMPEAQRKAELEKIREYTEPLSMIGMMYELEDDEEQIQLQIDVYSEEYPELRQIISGMEDPKRVGKLYYAAESYQKRMSWPEEYTDYIRYVRDEAVRMSTSPIFNKKDSFSASNIQKTAEDFKPCLEIQPQICDDQFFKVFHDWNIGDILAIFMVLIIAATLFLKEQENGMVYLIHSTPNGRLATSIAKLTAGLLLSAAIIVSFSGEELLLTGLMFGFPQWDIPVQSVPVFRECTYIISIRGYIALFFLQKIAAMVMLMAVFAFFVPLFRNSQLVYFFMIVVTALEYVFFRFLHPSSYLNILKFLNLFYLFSPVNFFTEYQNLNFFGHALGIFPFLLTFWIVTTFVLTYFYCRFSIHKPELSISMKVFHLPVHPERGTVSLMWQEGWRAFFSGKGILVWILAIFLAVSWYQDFPQRTMGQEEAGYYQYVRKFGGKLTPEKEAEIDEAKERLDNIYEMYDSLAQSYRNKEITADEYNEKKMEIYLLEQTEDGFRAFRDQYFDLQILQAREIEASILDQPSLDFLFKNRTRDFVVATLTILLLMMVIIPMGHTGENMERLIRSTPKGRLALFSRRMIYTVVFALVMLAGKWLPIILVFHRQYQISDWTAAIQHLKIYFPWEGTMSIQKFMLLWITMQVLSMLVYGFWFLVLSQSQSRTSLTALTCIMLVFITMAAFLAEIPGVCYINPAEAFAPVPMQLLTYWPVYLLALLAELGTAVGVGIYKARYTD